MILCELAGKLYLGIEYVCVSICWTMESNILWQWNLKTRKQGVI